MDVYKQIIKKEKERWLKLNYSDWDDFKSSNPIGFNEENNFNNIEYQIEVDLLELTDAYIHPSLAIDFLEAVKLDGKHVSPYKPLCIDWLVYKDGRIDI